MTKPNEKQTQRYREQVSGYQKGWGAAGVGGGIGETIKEGQVYADRWKINFVVSMQ